MERPRLLDAFCGAGGSSMGYSLAGFDVTGVDIRPQPRFPFRFVQADALEYLREHGREYDALAASPPCQGYSIMHHAVGSITQRLIGVTRELLEATGRPFVIENVDLAAAFLRKPLVMLCGTMFGLRVRRHRLFEVNPAPIFWVHPVPCTCRGKVASGELIGHRVAGKVAPGRTQPPRHTEAERREAIGVPWMTTAAARQAVPPAYTRWLGAHLLRIVEDGQ